MVVAAPTAIRKPTAKVNAPVKFLDYELVNDKSQEHCRGDVQVEQEIKRHHKRAVNHKQDGNPERRAAQVDVIGFEWRADGAVMAQVSEREKVLREMQEIAVIEVFEGIRPEQAGAKSN